MSETTNDCLFLPRGFSTPTTVQPIDLPLIPDMIRRVAYAVATSEGRYAMDGVLVDLKERRLRLVATDGKRLALAERPLAEPVADPVFAVFPISAMDLVSRMLAKRSTEAPRTGGYHTAHYYFHPDEGYVHIRVGQASILARLVPGHYPPYEEIMIPDRPGPVVDRRALVRALRKVDYRAARGQSPVVAIEATNSSMTITSRAMTRVTETITADSAEPITVGCNPRYLLQAIKPMTSRRVMLGLHPRDAMTLTETTPPSGGTTYRTLIMPVSLSS